MKTKRQKKMQEDEGHITVVYGSMKYRVTSPPIHVEAESSCSQKEKEGEKQD